MAIVCRDPGNVHVLFFTHEIQAMHDHRVQYTRNVLFPGSVLKRYVGQVNNFRRECLMFRAAPALVAFNTTHDRAIIDYQCSSWRSSSWFGQELLNVAYLLMGRFKPRLDDYPWLDQAHDTVRRVYGGR